MNPETETTSVTAPDAQQSGNGTGLAYVAGILGALLIVIVLVWAMHHYTQPAPLGEARKLERAKILGEMRAADYDAQHNVGWVDPAKGIVRLSTEDAMAMVVRNWQNPAAGRSNLIQRVEKANAVAPNPFE